MERFVDSILPKIVVNDHTLSPSFVIPIIRYLREEQKLSKSIVDTFLNMAERNLDLMIALAREGLLEDPNVYHLERFEGVPRFSDIEKPYAEIHWDNEGWRQLLSELFWLKYLLVCKGGSSIFNTLPYEIRDIIGGYMPLQLIQEFHLNRKARIAKIDPLYRTIRILTREAQTWKNLDRLF